MYAGTNIKTDAIVHPGEILQELLDEQDMTQKKLAEVMERPVQVINEIINGKRAITAETALQLESATGMSADMWIRLEGQYRLALARQKHGDEKNVCEMAVEAFVRCMSYDNHDPVRNFKTWVDYAENLVEGSGTPVTSLMNDSAEWIESDDFKVTHLAALRTENPEPFEMLRVQAKAWQDNNLFRIALAMTEDLENQAIRAKPDESEEVEAGPRSA